MATVLPDSINLDVEILRRIQALHLPAPVTSALSPSKSVSTI